LASMIGFVRATELVRCLVIGKPQRAYDDPETEYHELFARVMCPRNDNTLRAHNMCTKFQVPSERFVLLVKLKKIYIKFLAVTLDASRKTT
jgi:hypothetical protein